MTTADRAPPLTPPSAASTAGHMNAKHSGPSAATRRGVPAAAAGEVRGQGGENEIITVRKIISSDILQLNNGSYQDKIQ